jgi:hypothetical protein
MTSLKQYLSFYGKGVLFQLLLISLVTVAKAQVDQQLAQLYFKEAQALCERDCGAYQFVGQW